MALGGKERSRWFSRATLLWLLLASAACGRTGGVLYEKDGEGALYSAPGQTWGVNQSDAKDGVTWSAGSVTLCRSSPTQAPVIQNVEPVSVRGEVRLDSIGVRAARRIPEGTHGPSNPNKYLVGTFRGVPRGLTSPSGFVVPATCRDPGQPVGEIVVTLTKTGDPGGVLSGLRVTYDVAMRPMFS